jgi:hypothetical protein
MVHSPRTRGGSQDGRENVPMVLVVLYTPAINKIGDDGVPRRIRTTLSLYAHCTFQFHQPGRTNDQYEGHCHAEIINLSDSNWKTIYANEERSQGTAKILACCYMEAVPRSIGASAERSRRKGWNCPRCSPAHSPNKVSRMSITVRNLFGYANLCKVCCTVIRYSGMHVDCANKTAKLMR